MPVLTITQKIKFLLFYIFKPVIPRGIQIWLRRMIVKRQRRLYKDIWPIDKRAGTAPREWPGWPGGKKFALVLMHDVDTKKGHDRCRYLMEMEERLGFRSSFNFVPERYANSHNLREDLIKKGFEVGVHGLKHDGWLFFSHRIFKRRAVRINPYIREWGVKGFSSPSMHHNLNWMKLLEIAWGTTTFDTDPFEPQSDGVKTLFPFWVQGDSDHTGYVELPYTLTQDFTLYILMEEKTTSIWEEKLDWIASKGGMALFNTHPDYMNFNKNKPGTYEYPVDFYERFLKYISKRYEGEYWHVLPREIAEFWRRTMVDKVKS